MEFSSGEFYDNELMSDPSVIGHVLSDLTHVAKNEETQTPLLFIDTAGAGWEEEQEPDGESRRNPEEARLVIRLVKKLIQMVLPEEIAVIAPYAAQVRLLRDGMQEPGLEIDTRRRFSRERKGGRRLVVGSFK